MADAVARNHQFPSSSYTAEYLPPTGNVPVFRSETISNRSTRRSWQRIFSADSFNKSETGRCENVMMLVKMTVKEPFVYCCPGALLGACLQGR